MKNGPYELVIAPVDYPGKKYRNRYVYEHHLVWWTNKKELISKGFEIHHKNGNHRDNKISNLQKVTSKEHKLLHGKQRSKISKLDLKCNTCGINFLRRGSDYRFRNKNSKTKKVYCSIYCQHESMKIL